MADGDIVIDFDSIANALSGRDPANHEHTSIVKQVTKAARDAAITAARKHTSTVDVLIIHSTPSQATLDSYRAEGADIITIDPGKATVMHRGKTERPTFMLAVAARWYDQRDHPTKKPQAHERGYDWRHRNNRKRLLHNLTDGTPCPGCGNPMYRDPKKNHDGAALEADHTHDLKHHGPNDADRLLCRTCNRSRGDGHDERLPTNQTPTTQNGEPIDWGWIN